MTAETPGLVCAHHHLYSALARGMPAPPSTPRRFGEILEQIWWRLDAALDLDMLRASARLGALEALLAGTTGIVDHHESPHAIEGSLDVIADACAEVGVRVVCAYGVTDRHGADGARRGLAENERFLRAGGRGHGRRARRVHVHRRDAGGGGRAGRATSASASTSTSPKGPRTPAAGERLAGLAADDWLLVHCVGLDRDLPGTIAHNPRSNMNNAVGYARPARRPNDVVLGTDGIGADMLEEFRLAYVAHRADDVLAVPDTAWSWLTNPSTPHSACPVVVLAATRPGAKVILRLAARHRRFANSHVCPSTLVQPASVPTYGRHRQAIAIGTARDRSRPASTNSSSRSRRRRTSSACTLSQRDTARPKRMARHGEHCQLLRRASAREAVAHVRISARAVPHAWYCVPVHWTHSPVPELVSQTPRSSRCSQCSGPMHGWQVPLLQREAAGSVQSAFSRHSTHSCRPTSHSGVSPPQCSALSVHPTQMLSPVQAGRARGAMAVERAGDAAMVGRADGGRGIAVGVLEALHALAAVFVTDLVRVALHAGARAAPAPTGSAAGTAATDAGARVSARGAGRAGIAARVAAARADTRDARVDRTAIRVEALPSGFGLEEEAAEERARGRPSRTGSRSRLKGTMELRMDSLAVSGKRRTDGRGCEQEDRAREREHAAGHEQSGPPAEVHALAAVVTCARRRSRRSRRSS